MIDFYTSSTPNGLKIALFLAESGIAHRTIRLSLSGGDQYKPEFLAISPNNKIPAIVDRAPADGGEPMPIFESGAILLYLAEKHGCFLPLEPRLRVEALKWLFWQVGGLGPMAGQAGHFLVHAPVSVPYAEERYVKELRRLYGVLDRHLAGRHFIAGDYSIADMACYPWIVPHAAHGQSLEMFPNLAAWFARIAERPATLKAYEGVEDSYGAPLSETARRVLFAVK